MLRATTDVPDPIAYAINHMLDHIQAMDKQLETCKKHSMMPALNTQNPPH